MSVTDPASCTEFRIGVGLGLDDGADVVGQSRVLPFARLSGSRGEFLQEADPVASLVQPLLDDLAPPTETPLGLAGAAAAQFGGDLGHVRSALASGQPS